MSSLVVDGIVSELSTIRELSSLKTKSFEDDIESAAYNEGITELNAEFIEDVESDTDSDSIEPDDEMDREYNAMDKPIQTDRSELTPKLPDTKSPEESVRLRTNRKGLRQQQDESGDQESNDNHKNKLDSVRFSMYNIQNSQINEIDALLSELNQLQTTLDYTTSTEDQLDQSRSDFLMNGYHQHHNQDTQLQQSLPMQYHPQQQQFFHNPYMASSQFNCYNNVVYEANEENVEAIDQQFDEVLKFLAQTIDGEKYNTGSVSPDGGSSSVSSPSFNSSDQMFNIDRHHLLKQRADDGMSGSGSNSSGIGEDFDNQQHSPESASKLAAMQNSTGKLAVEMVGGMKLKDEAGKRGSADSAFLDAISMPSSATSLTANSCAGSKNLNQPLLISNESGSQSSSSGGVSSEPSPVETVLDPKQQAEAHKAELIRIALEKLKEANIKKIIVKAYTDDGCTKSVIIDESMRIYDVMLLLFNKNHSRPTVNYSVVEFLPKFHMERVFEDHENLVEAMSNWSRDSENQIIFTEKASKNDLFVKPEFYLMNENIYKIDDSQRNRIIGEFFQNIGSSVPEVEGNLYFKVESKKSWKKFYCVLRQSGLYYSAKSKTKKDMQCLFNFDKLDLYYGIDWKKEFKAPTDFCFALKYPQVQKKSSKYVKYLCCESECDMKRWVTGIRIAKFGKQLLENYKQTLDLMKTYDQTGRLPVVPNRRLSTSVSNANIRPRSSLSVASSGNHTTNQQNQQQHLQQVPTIIECSQDSSDSLLEQTNVAPTSLLMRKDQCPVSDNKQATLNGLNRTMSNVSYTDQLKSLLQAHQTSQREQQTQQQQVKESSPALAPTTRDKRTPSPQATSTGTLSRVANRGARIPLSTDVTKQMLSLNPVYGQDNERQPVENLTYGRMSGEGTLTRPKPCDNPMYAHVNGQSGDATLTRLKPTVAEDPAVYMVDFEMTRTSTGGAVKPCKNSIQTEILLTQSYKLPEAQKNEPIMRLATTTTTSATPNEQAPVIEPFTKPSANLIIRNSKSVQQTPPVAPKPVFKRHSSNNTTNSSSISSSSSNYLTPVVCQSSSTSNNGDHYNRFAALTTTKSTNNRNSTCSNNSQQNTPELINELSLILARQKKKVDDAIESQVVSKPPPPPRRVH